LTGRLGERGIEKQHSAELGLGIERGICGNNRKWQSRAGEGQHQPAESACLFHDLFDGSG